MACARTAKAHAVKVSLALEDGHLMISPQGTLLSVEKALKYPS